MRTGSLGPQEPVRSRELPGGSTLGRMLGEFDLIGLLRERIAAAGAPEGDHVIVGSGDDAAVVEPLGTSHLRGRPRRGSALQALDLSP